MKRKAALKIVGSPRSAKLLKPLFDRSLGLPDDRNMVSPERIGSNLLVDRAKGAGQVHFPLKIT